MKTPEEIRKAIEACKDGTCYRCPYCKNKQTCVEELADDTLAYIQQLKAALPQWISVEERLPEHGRQCLAFGHKGKVHHMDIVKRGKTGTWEFGMMTGFKITHWMPLPRLPVPTPDREAKDIDKEAHGA